ncbi:hypothetical protein N0V95_002797 [Ascochyta clinopodiicola]|nr:hypothetical protein N0V95_002797 [Ascochyta clinopodiicola]
MNDEDLEMRPTILKRENIALREKLAAFQDIFEHLQGRTKHVAHDTVQRLGAGTDPSNLLKTLRGESPRAVLSEQATARAILPAVHSDCELELLVRHPKAYCVLDLPLVAQDTPGTDVVQQSYSSIHPEAAKHSHQFEQQAEKLFAAEGTVDTLPTVAALALLYISIAVRADVPRAMKYLIAAKDAAKRMNLFGEPDPATFGSLKTREASSQTAWGLFNFHV